MTEKSTQKHAVDYKSIDDMPKPKPLSKQVKAKTEKQIQASMASDPDAGITPSGFWESAEVIFPHEKVSVGIRLDSDVLEWFKGAGKGYQTRINAVLKSYMNAHKGMN